MFLLNAGHETTTNLIGNGLHVLLTHADSLRQLREEPQLISSAVEECLRFESPNQLGNRLVVQRTVVRDAEDSRRYLRASLDGCAITRPTSSGRARKSR